MQIRSLDSDEVLAWAIAWVAEAGPRTPITFQETRRLKVPVFDGTGGWRDTLIGGRVTVEPVAYLKEAIRTVRACRDGVINDRSAVKAGTEGPYGEAWYAARGIEAIEAIASVRGILEAQPEAHLEQDIDQRPDAPS